MEALHNRAVAILLCLLMIAGACILGNGLSLRRMRERTEFVFLLGETGNGRGLEYDLRELASECYNITVIAGRYLPEGDPTVAAVLAARERLSSAQNPGEKHQAATEMISATAITAAVLEGYPLEGRDSNDLQAALVNLDNTRSLMASSSYNASARYFNRTLEKFPSRLLGPLTGIKPLELFE